MIDTTINDTTDFSIGKKLTNLPALPEIVFSANRRLLASNQLSCDPITGAEALRTNTSPRRSPPKPASAIPGCI